MLNAVGQAQHILLLGGTSEIGLGVVSEFLQRGSAKVTLAARPESPRIGQAKADLESRGADVEGRDFEEADFDGPRAGGKRGWARGDVDVAIVAFGTLGDQEELWQNHDKAVASAQTNYTAPVSVGVLLGEKFKRQGHGTIIAMSSVAGMRVRRSNFVYGASKAGVDGFYINLGEALRGTGANVLVVRPGQVRTKMSAEAGDAPLTVNVSDVAEATVKAVLEGKQSIFVHPLFEYVSLAFKFIPQAIFRKLPF